MITLSHHRRQLLQRCSLAHYWHYTKRLRSISHNIDFYYGNALHVALALYYKTKCSADDVVTCFVEQMDASAIDMVDQPKRYKLEKVGKILLPAYLKAVKDSDEEVLAVESSFVLPVERDGKANTDEPFIAIATKPDLVIRDKDGVWIRDNKTTALSKEDFENNTIYDTQLADYCMVWLHKYPDIRGGVYNVFRKDLDGDHIFRVKRIFTPEQLTSSMIDFLDAAEIYYMTEGTRLETSYSRQYDCNRCEFKDPCLIKRQGGDYESILNMYYTPIEKFDWEDDNV